MNGIEKQRARWRSMLPGLAYQISRAVDSNEEQPEGQRLHHAAEAVGNLLGCGIYLRVQHGPGPNTATLTIGTGQASGDYDEELVIEAQQPARKACKWNARIDGPATTGPEAGRQKSRVGGARDAIDETAGAAVERLARAAIRMAIPGTAWRAWICTWHFTGVAEAFECRARTQRAISIVDCWQRETGNRIWTLTAALAEGQCELRIRHNTNGAANGVSLGVPRERLGQLRQLRSGESNWTASNGPAPLAVIGVGVHNHGTATTIEAEAEGRTLLGMLQSDEGRTTARNKLKAALKAVACHPDVATRHALDGARQTAHVRTLGKTWLNG